MGACKNRLSEAVLTCTHDLCFEQKKRKYCNFSFENNHFYSREILLYIVWACYRNEFVITQGTYMKSE